MKCSRPLEFRRRSGLWVKAPCGKCPACRVNRATEWATRIMHELEGKNKTGYFLTLTYKEAPPSLEKAELQKFFKRVRKDIELKYFACGEYGEDRGRPHYHVAAITKNAPSVQWNKYWTLGYIDVKPLVFASARYTANYMLKQSNQQTTTSQGPFQLMSKGLGGAWAEANAKSVRAGLTRNGNPVTTPRYYRKKLDIQVPKIEDTQEPHHWQQELNNDALIERKIRRNKL